LSGNPPIKIDKCFLARIIIVHSQTIEMKEINMPVLNFNAKRSSTYWKWVK
jgi:hypothetical protein